MLCLSMSRLSVIMNDEIEWKRGVLRCSGQLQVDAWL